MKKLLIIALIASAPTILKAQKLPEGTIVNLSLSQELTCETSSVGQLIELETSEPVIEGDKVLVPKGAKAYGQITEVVRTAIKGKSGKLSFSINYLSLPDGKKAKLTSVQSSAPKDKLVNFTFGKGRQAVFQKGFLCKAFVSSGTEI